MHILQDFTSATKLHFVHDEIPLIPPMQNMERIEYIAYSLYIPESRFPLGRY